MADDTDSGLPVHQLLIPSDAIQFSHALASACKPVRLRGVARSKRNLVCIMYHVVSSGKFVLDLSTSVLSIFQEMVPLILLVPRPIAGRRPRRGAGDQVLAALAAAR